NPQPNSEESDRVLIREAVATARRADAVLLVLGENELTCREAWSENHLGDRDNLDLPGRQQALADAVLATGKPVVVLLLNGRPLSITRLAETAPAILEGWYLGQETGPAVAHVLFGRVSPSGKLTATIPRTVGQLPCYYNKRPSQHRSYVLADNRSLFPFGYGLSYTQFSYRDLRLVPDTIPAGGRAVVEIEVENTGHRDGEEVVQLYVHDKIGSLPRPVKELKDFARVHLKAGETKIVRFILTPEKLQFLDINMRHVVEPGEFEVIVGGNSVEALTSVLRVI
ncbi:glycoside hydrolase family 3 C-terminal domain-containing protein, partial [candidate division KSB1 bacterium]|nr:glycoside hydrolase family 3 C-terminal domain-containing protein [candidate division KSB1 bacterium]